MSISILSDGKPRTRCNMRDDKALPIQYCSTKRTGSARPTQEKVPDDLGKRFTFRIVRKGRSTGRSTERDSHDLACILTCLDI